MEKAPQWKMSEGVKEKGKRARKEKGEYSSNHVPMNYHKKRVLRLPTGERE